MKEALVCESFVAQASLGPVSLADPFVPVLLFHVSDSRFGNSHISQMIDKAISDQSRSRLAAQETGPEEQFGASGVFNKNA